MNFRRSIDQEKANHVNLVSLCFRDSNKERLVRNKKIYCNLFSVCMWEKWGKGLRGKNTLASSSHPIKEIHFGPVTLFQYIRESFPFAPGKLGKHEKSAFPPKCKSVYTHVSEFEIHFASIASCLSTKTSPTWASPDH